MLISLAVWLYECCSTVSTELATRCSDSIPRILRWSATKGQIWLTAFEEKMIKPEWIKFTSMTESGEEIGVLTLPNKIEYEDEQGARSSEVPNADSPTLEPKHTDCQEDKESVAKKLRKLEKRIEQVDGKLEDFRKAVFEELHDLRVFIDDSVKSALNLINRKYDVDEAKSPIHGVTVAGQTEQVIEKQLNEGKDAHHVDEVVSEGSGIDKKGVTLDDFDLPDNLTQLVKYGEPIPDEATPIYPGRTRRKAPFSIKDNQIKPWLDLGVEKVDKKDWFYSLAHPGQVLNDSHIDVIMYYLRKRGKYGPNNNTRFTTTDCLFKSKIEQIYEKFISSPPEKKNFHWLLVVFDIADRQLYVYDSMVSSHHHNAVESCVDKFSIIIPLYLSCTGFYGKRKDIDFKTTKYVSLGDLSIPSEDLSDIDQHRRCYGALLWDYAIKKQEDGSISESEVTGRLARRKSAPALNEKTRVERKKK
uniref:Uncharacterized protein LOC104216824 n=1 Tax=Nicotiana sylvestris TaxID=4096 RepID=A0A1U7VTK4_NICSY|nr:PREDICTED: uncharacterized protein LOC104216824 [Nicotiana sylvestris]